MSFQLIVRHQGVDHIIADIDGNLNTIRLDDLITQFVSVEKMANVCRYHVDMEIIDHGLLPGNGAGSGGADNSQKEREEVGKVVGSSGEGDDGELYDSWFSQGQGE